MMFFVNCDWNWPAVLDRTVLKVVNVLSLYIDIISLCKKCVLYNKLKSLFTVNCFMQSLVEIGQVVLETQLSWNTMRALPKFLHRVGNSIIINEITLTWKLKAYICVIYFKCACHKSLFVIFLFLSLQAIYWDLGLSCKSFIAMLLKSFPFNIETH